MDRLNLIIFYFELGLKYLDILQVLAVKHGIVLSLTSLKRILCKNGLFRRKTYDDIGQAIRLIRNQLQGTGALHGYRWMYSKCIEQGVRVRKEDVRLILSTLDPDGTHSRRARRLNRRAYYAKGPNYIWHVDSYDKLKPFGICINGAIDGYSRRLIWLKAYHTSSDPRVIGGYFLEAVVELGGSPHIVRTDNGTENSVVRDTQRFFRRNDEDGGDRSFLYGRSTANQRIESWWGHLRKECIEFWLDHFHRLKGDGDFDGDFLDKNLVIFCFLSLIQDELDATRECWNSYLIRPSRNENVPHGRPDVMYTVPELYGSEDYLCHVPEQEIINCETNCLHRSDIACDEDVYSLCTYIMAEYNLTVPEDIYMGINLYLTLKEKIGIILNL